MATNSIVSLCNEALAEVRVGPIPSLDEDVAAGRECSRSYPSVLSEALEAHQFTFSNKRAPLAPVANPRSVEWGYAYAMPAGVGTPRRIIPAQTAPAGLPAQYAYATPVAPIGGWPSIPYIIADGVLFTSIPNAVLEYGADDIDVGRMTAVFRRHLVLSLAARLAISLRDDPAIKTNLQKEAELALQRAIAHDENLRPRVEGYDEVAFVRQGGDIGLGEAIWGAR